MCSIYFQTNANAFPVTVGDGGTGAMSTLVPDNVWGVSGGD